MKKLKLISFVLILCIVLSSLSFVSCEKEEEKTKFSAYSLDYFDTATTITGYEVDKETFDRVSGEVLTLLGEYHMLYTIYHRFENFENLCTINELKDGKHRTVTVDPRIIDMLLYAKEMYTLTGGKLNIAMGSVLSIWHNYRTEGINEPWAARIPSSAELEEAAKHTDKIGRAHV